jgi:hypothetical protein
MKHELPANENDPGQLAAAIKAWRGRVPARVAADLLGVPLRTFHGIEQGRGFPYPRLLRIAMQHTPISAAARP